MSRPALPLIAAALLATSPGAIAADARLGAEICAAIATVAQEVQQFDPEAARQRFVAVVDMKFGDDPARLRQVRSSIDRESMAGCHKERASLMKVMQVPSLAEALEQSPY